jgi:hypothetical protein
MDVAHELQKIGFILTDDRLITVRKEMATPLVAAIKGYGVASHKRPHDPGQMDVSAPEQKMKMVRKQSPSITTDLRR